MLGPSARVSAMHIVSHFGVDPFQHPPRRARAAMALAALSGDEQCIIFSQLCNVLDSRVAGIQQHHQRVADADAGAAAAAEG